MIHEPVFPGDVGMVIVPALVMCAVSAVLAVAADARRGTYPLSVAALVCRVLSIGLGLAACLLVVLAW